MSSDKYAKITNTSKATANRDLADLLANGLLHVEGVGKATRYCVNVPGWEQPAIKGQAPSAASHPVPAAVHPVVFYPRRPL